MNHAQSIVSDRKMALRSLSFASLLLLILFPSPIRAEKETDRWIQVWIEGECAEILPQLPSFDPHSISAANGGIRTIIRAADSARLVESGCQWMVEINDMTAWYRQRAADELRDLKSGITPAGASDDPVNFRLGSVAGSYTIEEFESITDSMATLYPELIRKSRIGTSVQGKPIWLFTIEAPGSSVDRPRALYTGLTHAREPLSMVNLIYTMWTLVEGYGEDPAITRLLEERVLHFVPMVNPDGYGLNLRDSPQGGGMWRKNYRGVDLNRNWGPDENWSRPEEGGSDSPSSDFYRGPSPFSEPEVQGLRHLYDSLDIAVALHHHSMGNVLLYNHDDHHDVPSDGEWSIYSADALSRETGCGFAPSPLGIGYLASGTVTGFTAATPSTAGYSWTPESGTPQDGFWPLPSRYLPLCRSYHSMNLRLARIAADFVVHDGATVNSDRSITLRFRNVGSASTVDGIEIVLDGHSASSGRLIPNQTFEFTLSPEQSVALLDRARNRLSGVVRSGPFSDSFHVELPGWKSEVLFEEEFDDGLIRWSADLWGVETFDGAGRVLADSPYEMTTFSSIPNVCRLRDYIDLSGYEAADLRIRARGTLQGMSYGLRVRARSVESETWVPLRCELFQQENRIDDTTRSVLRGDHGVWREYSLSLDSFAGKSIRLEFEVRTDARYSVEMSEGVFIDNIRVVGARSASSVQEVRTFDRSTKKFERLVLATDSDRETLHRLIERETGSDHPILKLIDVTGREIGTWQQTGEMIEDLGELPAGYYLLVSDRLTFPVMGILLP